MAGKAKWKQEIERLWSQSQDGLLRAEEVVDFASDPKTALHKHFEWNDTKAAHQYRLKQARELIVEVTVLMPKANTEIQAFVSLKTDRSKRGGGYRRTDTVLSVPETRDQLLQEMAADAQRFLDKWRLFDKVAKDVFATMRKFIAAQNRRQQRKKKKR